MQDRVDRFTICAYSSFYGFIMSSFIFEKKEMNESGEDVWGGGGDGNDGIDTSVVMCLADNLKLWFLRAPHVCVQVSMIVCACVYNDFINFERNAWIQWLRHVCLSINWRKKVHLSSSHFSQRHSYTVHQHTHRPEKQRAQAKSSKHRRAIESRSTENGVP